MENRCPPVRAGRRWEATPVQFPRQCDSWQKLSLQVRICKLVSVSENQFVCCDTSCSGLYPTNFGTSCLVWRCTRTIKNRWPHLWLDDASIQQYGPCRTFSPTSTLHSQWALCAGKLVAEGATGR